MMVLGGVLFVLGAVAAWKVHQLQHTSDAVIAREVESMLTINELYAAMREIRYQLNLYLRSDESSHVAQVSKIHEDADRLLESAHRLVRTERERELVANVDKGYAKFFDEFEPLNDSLMSRPATEAERLVLERLADDVLSNQVLAPLKECATLNRSVADLAKKTATETAQTLKVGLLLLGICGGLAGLLLGIGIARAVGRSIVRLDVSVRSAVGRLGEATRPVVVSRSGDLFGLETSVKQLEEEIGGVVAKLQQKERELLRTEQLAQVGQLAAGLAHELRNPLMPMKMLVQAALETQGGRGLDARALQVLDSEISRLEATIQSLLDFARPPTLEKSLVVVPEIVQSTIDLVSARAVRQNVELHTILDKNNLTIVADPAQIRQLLLNLLLNALDALPTGGVITVQVAAAANMKDIPLAQYIDDSEHSLLRLPAQIRAVHRAAPRMAEISIRDNGKGFPSHLISRIFDPFITTKESGSGLGLSICQRIVHAHGGAIFARNPPSGGAEIFIRIPAATVTPARAP